MFELKSKIFIFFLTFLIVNEDALASSKTPVFALTNITEARKLAAEQNKVVLVDFCASWCKPCQWMEKTTYNNEKVRETLFSDFITVKIDIDEADGYELKKIYDVKFLPTILVFSPHGELIDRIEQTLSPHKFIEVVKSYHHRDNRVANKHALNKSPNENTDKKASDFILKRDIDISDNYYDRKSTKPSYKVQVGTFTSYEVAEDMVRNLRKFFAEPVTVAYEYEKDVPVFRVRIGQFVDINSAQFFRDIMKEEYNMDGTVI